MNEWRIEQKRYIVSDESSLIATVHDLWEAQGIVDTHNRIESDESRLRELEDANATLTNERDELKRQFEQAQERIKRLERTQSHVFTMGWNDEAQS